MVLQGHFQCFDKPTVLLCVNNQKKENRSSTSGFKYVGLSILLFVMFQLEQYWGFWLIWFMNQSALYYHALSVMRRHWHHCHHRC